MTVKVAEQYKRMERVAIKKRLSIYKQRAKSLLLKMKKDKISSRSNIEELRKGLNKHHLTNEFLTLDSIAEILNLHAENLWV